MTRKKKVCNHATAYKQLFLFKKKKKKVILLIKEGK